MVNVVDIVASAILGVVVIAISIYLFTIYCHPDQKGLGNAPLLKILVIASQALAWGQILLLPLDLSVTNSDPQSDFIVIYQIYYPVMFILVVFVNPFAINFYQSDQNDSMCSRVVWSIFFAFIITFIFSGWVFIGYVWLGVYTVQGNQNRVNALLYILPAMSLVGWILLALHGGIGLIQLPVGLISYFSHRPKMLSSQQALNKKAKMQSKSGELITQGQKLKTQGEQLSRYEGGWFSRKKAQAKFQRNLEKYKKNINLLEQEYQIFDSEIKSRSTPRIVYVVALVAGLLSITGTILWIFQILGMAIIRNGQPLYQLVDLWLSNIGAGNASFVGTIIYAVMMLFMQVCLSKGNSVFGIRIPFIMKVHPMIPHKTLMNSLLFNSNLMLLASMSSSFLALWCFPNYLAGSSLAQVNSIVFNNLPLYGALYGNKIPMIVLLAISILALIIFIIQISCRKCKGKKLLQRAK